MRNLITGSTRVLDKILNPFKTPLVAIFLSIAVYHLSDFGVMGSQLIPKIPYIAFFDQQVGTTIRDISPVFSFLGKNTDLMLNYICTYSPMFMFLLFFKQFGLKVLFFPFRLIKSIFTFKKVKKESNADFIKRSANYKYQQKEKVVKKKMSMPKFDFSNLFKRKVVAAHEIPFDPKARNYLLKNFIVKDMKRWNEMPDY